MAFFTALLKDVTYLGTWRFDWLDYRGIRLSNGQMSQMDSGVTVDIDGRGDGTVTYAEYIFNSRTGMDELVTYRDRVVSIENFIGTNRNDWIRGGNGDNRLYGDQGLDTLIGDAGNDILGGESGNDRLIGGLGLDRLFGGGGGDTFVFETDRDSGKGSRRDIIGDFSVAEGDLIDLSAIDADTVTAGTQDFTFVGNAAFSGDAGELRFSRGRLQADLDGDAKVDFEVRVVGVQTLTIDSLVL
jgi:Ca2+-binding RTX toxin-like protein